MNSSPAVHSAPTPKKSNKTWIIIVLVLLILCCLCVLIGGIAGYFYTQNNSSTMEETFQTIFPTSQANETNPSEEVRMEAGGYSFRQPPDYEVLSTIEDFGIITIEIEGKDWTDSEVGEGPEISLNGFTNSNQWSLEEFAEYGNDLVIGNYTATSSAAQEVTVAGLRGIAYDYEYHLPVVGLIRYRDIYVMVTPNQLFNINCFSPAADWDKTLADFDAIIESLTFFEPVPAPAETP